MGERGAQRETATPEDIEAMAALAARGGRGRRARLQHVAHAATTAAQQRRAHAHPHRRRRRAASASPGPSAPPAPACCRSCPTSPTSTPSSALFRSHGRGVGPAAVVLARPASTGDSTARQLELLDEANADGVRMRGQVAPAAIGILLGLQCTLHPLLGNPVWQEIAALAGRRAGPRHGRARASRSGSLAAGRAQAAGGSAASTGCSSSATRPTTSPTRRRASPPGRPARAATPLDLAYDLLLRTSGRTFLYLPFLNYVDGNLDAVGEMLAHPHTVPGLATAAPTSARSATPASRPRCSRSGAATATTAGSTCRSSCASTPGHRARRSGCSTAACSRRATAPTST